MRTSATATVIGLAAAALSVLPASASVPSTTSAPSAPQRTSASPRVVPVSGDATVKATHKSANYGSRTRLVVDGRRATRSQALLRVRVPDSVDGRAFKLVLRPLTSSAGGVRVFATRQAWNEDTVTWSTRPTRNRGLIGTSNALEAGKKEVIDLDPSLVKPGRALSLRVRATGSERLAFSAAEGATGTRPRLRLSVTADAPTPAPAPAATETMFGACPTVGTSTSSVISKYGTGASVRIFVPGDFAPVSRPAGASKVHVSWKPALGSTITDADLIDAFAGLHDGDLVEVWHESDVKYRKGDALAPMIALKNQFHDRVVALREAGRIPQVLTVNTWAGWSVDSTSDVDTAPLHARADILGVDMDGIPSDDDFYPYAERQMAAKFIAAYRAGGYTGWTVPEFSMPSVSSDPSGARRVAWIQSEVAKISRGVPAAGIPAPQMIAWFDTAGIIGESEMLKAPSEIAAWSALVAGNL